MTIALTRNCEPPTIALVTGMSDQGQHELCRVVWPDDEALPCVTAPPLRGASIAQAREMQRAMDMCLTLCDALVHQAFVDERPRQTHYQPNGKVYYETVRR